IRRAARLADGWMPASRKPEDAKVLVEQLDRYLKEAGRDWKNFGIDPWISIANLPQDEWNKRVEGWRALGATHIAVDTMRAGFKSPQEHMNAIRAFRGIL